MDATHTATTSPTACECLDSVAERIQRAARLADRYAVSDIEMHGARVLLDGRPWYDTRPMLDEHEHDSISIDMARDCIDHAVHRALAVRHPEKPYLLHITPKGLGR